MTNSTIRIAVVGAGGRMGRQLIQAITQTKGVVLGAAVERAGIDPADVEDVIMGAAVQQGTQAYNIGRLCAYTGGLPDLCGDHGADPLADFQRVPSQPAGPGRGVSQPAPCR